jgi:hypothetical protein
MLHIVAHVDVDGIACHTIAEMWAREFKIVTRHYFVDYQNVGIELRTLSKEIGPEDEVLIADIGYSKDLIDFFLSLKGELTSKVSWFDHHRWNEEAIAKVKSSTKEFIVDEKLCASEILWRRFLPKSDIAKQLACLARAHDFSGKGSKQSDFDCACRIQDVITSGYSKELIVSQLSDGAIWIGSFEIAYRRYQEIKADVTRRMNETIEKYCISIDGVVVNVALAFALKSLEPKEAKKQLLKESNCEVVIVVWPNGRIAYEVVSERFMTVSQKINSNFKGGGRGLVGGATYPRSVKLEMRKQCFDEIIEVLEVGNGG